MNKILVTGTHRSGTTWVGKMLSINPGVSYVNEPFNVQHSNELLGLSLSNWYTYIPDFENPSKLLRAYAKMLSASESALPENKSATLIKDPIALLSAEHLASTFETKVVCMIRHPLSFCGSLKRWNWNFGFKNFVEQPSLLNDHFKASKREIMRFAESDQGVVEQGIFLWNLLNGVIQKFQKNNSEWIFLRHEDVVRDPLRILEAVYRQLELEFSDNCRSAIVASVSSEFGEVTDCAYKARDRKRVLQTWRQRLAPKEVTVVLEKTKVLRKQFYPSDFPCN